MTTVEDQARAAMRAIAGTVDDAPPLRLRPSRGPARRRASRHWRLWIAPAVAAAAVITLAITLVTLRDIPNGRVVPPVTHTPVPGDVPEYYAALATAGNSQIVPEQIVVGDTLTGKRLATVTPPAGTTFAGITGAADDRTFVVDTAPGNLNPESEPWKPRTWYLLRITPAAASRATLTRLPVPATAPGTNMDAIALSPDGTKLAVALQPGGLDNPEAPVYLRVYSVATGAVLRSWSATGAAAGGVFTGTAFHGPDRNLAVVWLGEDRLAFGYSVVKPGQTADGSEVTPSSVTLAQIRAVAIGSRSGDLLAASTVLATLAPGPRKPLAPLACGTGTLEQILLAANGTTLICEGTGEYRAPDGHLNASLCAAGPAWNRFGLLAYPTNTGGAARTLSQYASQCMDVGLDLMWTDASGSTQLGFLRLGQDGRPARATFGVFSHGAFTPLPTPPAGPVDSVPNVTYIAW